MFRFKQFSVDQSGCAMKINTDGVLLGAITEADNPGTILDIGTGTGVIALMLAQRFISAKIDAVEIDETSAQTAASNFKNSPFTERLTAYFSDINDYFKSFPGRKYDLIVSNPPFYTSSLKSPGINRALAKHTNVDFFERLLTGTSEHLAPVGYCWSILPVLLARTVIELAAQQHLFLQRVISVKSYTSSAPHRLIVCFGWHKVEADEIESTIYKEKDIYSDEYIKLLQPYFLAF